MNNETTSGLAPTRRQFLSTTAAVGGAMVLGFYMPSKDARAATIEGAPWYRDSFHPEINAWLTIAPDHLNTGEHDWTVPDISTSTARVAFPGPGLLAPLGRVGLGVDRYHR